MKSNTLYIIGNGFDLKHQIHSSYRDFFNWLIVNMRFDVIEELQRVCPIKEDADFILWSDFERAIEEIDIHGVVEWNWENLLVVETTYDNYLIGTPQSLIDTQLSEVILNNFTPWIKSIPIQATQLVKFNINSLFLTFNYTDTLEKVYQIPESDVLHIHGRASTNENLIVGHRNLMDPVQHLKYETDFREDNHRVENVYDYNKLYKPIENIISNNQAFFDKLSSVKLIEVIGHSCNDIDRLYFKHVCRCINPDAHWIFYWHNEENDIPNITAMIKYLKLGGNQYTLKHN